MLELKEPQLGSKACNMKQGEIGIIRISPDNTQIGMLVMMTYSNLTNFKGNVYGCFNKSKDRDFCPDWVIDILPKGTVLTVT